MSITRRGFFGSFAAAAAAATLPGVLSAGCSGKCACKCGGAKYGKLALQLYSIRDYIAKVGLEKALEDVATIGYQGVEFAGYYNFKPAQLKKMLDDNGLVAVGTHVGCDDFSPAKYAATCEFNLGYGNRFICCPGGGNVPPEASWSPKKGTRLTEVQSDWVKKLCDFYNQAAENCGKLGCFVGLHNHMWEHDLMMADGKMSYWDYFFSNTDKAVKMEQDVGWSTCAGVDPCAEYAKYPGRSLTIHAKENGMGPNVKLFDAILGQPGIPGAVGVDWDRLFKATDADKIEWYVVECERHSDSLVAARSSLAFLKMKGRG